MPIIGICRYLRLEEIRVELPVGNVLQALEPPLRGLDRPVQVLGPTRMVEPANVNRGRMHLRLDAKTRRTLERSIAAGADSVYVVSSRQTVLNIPLIVDFVTKNRLPLAGGWGAWAKSGGLLSYGPNVGVMARYAASYVDKILKGAKPADLPVQQPSKFELVINLKTAKALGLTIPPTVLALADELIE
jgi:ABC transporter substrate binding protein